MREPSIAVALLQLFCRDEALVGDVLEEYERRQSRAWLWRQVAVAVLLGLPYGMVKHPRTSGKMPMPVGGIGILMIAVLITVVAPGAWWLVALGAIGGILVGALLVATRRRRVDAVGRGNVLLK